MAVSEREKWERGRERASIGVSTDPGTADSFSHFSKRKNENIKFNHNIIQLLPLEVPESEWETVAN